jgi:DNA-binding MarR family transcriptional regulator
VSAQPLPVDFDGERAMRLLEEIHRLARELRDLTGDALSVRVEPVALVGGGAGVAREQLPLSASASPRARAADPPPGASDAGTVGTDAPCSRPPRSGGRSAGAEADRLVLAYLREHGNASQAAIADGTGMRIQRVVDALKRLDSCRPAGYGERARGTGGGRPSPVWELVAVDEAAPAPEEPPPLSPRTRKSIERAEREAEQEQQQPVEAEPVRSRVLDQLAHGPKAIPEIAKALGQPAVLVAQEIRMLQDRGLVEKQFSQYRRLDVGGSA